MPDKPYEFGSTPEPLPEEVSTWSMELEEYMKRPGCVEILRRAPSGVWLEYNPPRIIRWP